MDKAIASLRAAPLPIAPVNTCTQAAKDLHVLERDMLQPTMLADGNIVPITGPAVKFSRTPTSVRNRATEIGEHNAEIRDSIGLDAKAQQALADSGIIS